LTEAENEAAPSSDRPDELALSAPQRARAERRYAALHRRLEGDTLILLLLERESDDTALEASGDSVGNEMSGEDSPAETAPAGPRRPRGEVASTRRALAKGYTEKEIKNARERLKRHALAVTREDREDAESEP
jgi:hypothetical protein